MKEPSSEMIRLNQDPHSSASPWPSVPTEILVTLGLVRWTRLVRPTRLYLIQTSIFHRTRGDNLQISFLDYWESQDRFLIHFAERQLLPNPGLDQLWCHRCQDFLTKKLVLAFAPQTFHFTFRLNLNTSAMCFKWSSGQSVARKGAESPNGGRRGGSPRSIDTSATSNSTALWFGLIFTRLKQRYDFHPIGSFLDSAD